MGLGDLAIRVADHDYASTDPDRGYFWKLWDAGRLDPLVSREDVEACLIDGPDDGRGWARGRLVREYGDRITDVNWSHVEVKGDSSFWGSRVRIELPRPGSPTRDVFQPVLSAASDAQDIRRMLPTELASLVDGNEEDEEPDLQDEIVAPEDEALRLT
jgi:hypothetical protein